MVAKGEVGKRLALSSRPASSLPERPISTDTSNALCALSRNFCRGLGPFRSHFGICPHQKPPSKSSPQEKTVKNRVLTGPGSSKLITCLLGLMDVEETHLGSDR